MDRPMGWPKAWWNAGAHDRPRPATGAGWILAITLACVAGSVPARGGPAADPAGPAPACRDSARDLEQRVRTEMAPLRAAVKERIPAFGDWLFAWSVSYERERALVAAGLGGAYDRLVGGAPETLWSGAVERMDEVIHDSYRHIVLDPVDLDARAAVAWRALHDGMGAPPADTDTAPSGAGRDRQPLSLSGALIDAAGDPDQQAMIRGPRIILVRMASWALRRSVGLSVFGVVRLAMDTTDLGLWVAIPALAVGWGGSLATAMGLDYVMLKADEGLNRSALEDEFRTATDQAFDEVEAAWTARLETLRRLPCHAAAAGMPPPAASLR